LDFLDSREQWNQTPVTFNGKIPQEEMYKFYSKVDVLIAASIWPESFGLVTREAAAAGVWVVASNIGLWKNKWMNWTQFINLF
jgi:glycosyltransferase involved in cell wall biosynthesis